MTRPEDREVLEALLRHAERNECQHEETHRGGTIWTICDGCGKKWADDEGGFVPYKQPAAIRNARQLLDEWQARAALPATVALPPPVAWREDDGHWIYYDETNDPDVAGHIRLHQKDKHEVDVFALYSADQMRAAIEAASRGTGDAAQGADR